MGLGEFFRRLLGGVDAGRGVDDLAVRLGVTESDIRSVRVAYRSFTIPRRAGKPRPILAPEPPLKAMQRRILRRLLRRLECHPAATGFEKDSSIVTNASLHSGKAVVVRMDLKDFFPSTRAVRVEDFFRRLGWNRQATKLLSSLCTHRGGLPQGAPTSPRLSNLVNLKLDARLSGLARKLGAVYTRYADDLTFSFESDEPAAIHQLLSMTRYIVESSGYALHRKRKLHIRRRHQRQVVTGLVVNDGVRLPRETRRRLRAIEHRMANDRDCDLSPAQLAGWEAFREMVEKQGGRRD